MVSALNYELLCNVAQFCSINEACPPPDPLHKPVLCAFTLNDRHSLLSLPEDCGDPEGN